MSVHVGFDYCVKAHDGAELLEDIARWYNTCLITSSQLNSAWLTTRLHKFDAVECHVTDHNKQGFYYMYFKSKDQYDLLLKQIKDKQLAAKKKITLPLYRYSRGQWHLQEQYSAKPTESIVGYDNYINTICKDMDNHEIHMDYLKKLGEVRSINYLLYGPPGTGKTSIIKTIATLKKSAVFIVNTNDVTPADLQRALTPSAHIATECKFKLLLFEDFDRFLQSGDNSRMSQILNSLDGFDDSGYVIRFFTANNASVIMGNKALINRMSSKFEFHYPTREMFKAKLVHLMSCYKDVGDVEPFLDKVILIPNLTLRPFVNYVIRCLFDPDYLKKLNDCISELY